MDFSATSSLFLTHYKATGTKSKSCPVCTCWPSVAIALSVFPMLHIRAAKSTIRKVTVYKGSVAAAQQSGDSHCVNISQNEHGSPIHPPQMGSVLVTHVPT